MIAPRSDEHERLSERSGRRSDEHERLSERSGLTSLAQVYVGSLLLGGYPETPAADQAGMLADLLVD